VIWEKETSTYKTTTRFEFILSMMLNFSLRLKPSRCETSAPQGQRLLSVVTLRLCMLLAELNGLRLKLPMSECISEAYTKETLHCCRTNSRLEKGMSWLSSRPYTVCGAVSMKSSPIPFYPFPSSIDVWMKDEHTIEQWPLC
jgi:hypothetical protein